ncbi:MAG: pentapeptide repeat-containing protein [Planctomycetaceae bacterium]|jgi:uncharacterized protein YjbI with pentapeptide repeats|nr:pentapeptide repeat-containing protein [Planctomycetaceae bacterium]
MKEFIMATFVKIGTDSVPSGTFYPSSSDAVIANLNPSNTTFYGNGALEMDNSDGTLDQKINKADSTNEQKTVSSIGKTKILAMLFILLSSIFFCGAWCFGVVKLPDDVTDWGWAEFPFTKHIKVDGKDIEIGQDLTLPENEHLLEQFHSRRQEWLREFRSRNKNLTDDQVTDQMRRQVYELILRDKNLTDIQITRYGRGYADYGQLSDIDFAGSDLRHAVIRGVRFYHCNFDKTNMVDLNGDAPLDITGSCFNHDVFFDHEYTTFYDAKITYNLEDKDLRYRKKQGIRLFPKQIKQTSNFAKKCLNNCYFDFQRFWGTDFSDFRLSDSIFDVKGGLKDCKFDNATIYGCTFADISFSQLASTKDFRSGCLTEVTFKCTDFSFTDLSRMTLLRCTFGGEPYEIREEDHDEKIKIHDICDFEETNLTDAVITLCDFRNTKNLTAKQIKSTWNYKQNRMDGVKLPDDVQDKLDKEKKK